MCNCKNSPPRFARWILTRLSYYEEYFALSSALAEEFIEKRSVDGTVKAKIWYRMQVLAIIFQYIKLNFSWSVNMLMNYIKMAFRNLGRQKILAFINVVGLSLGITCAILIFLYIENENSYDRFHKQADRIYRVNVTENPPSRDAFTYVETPAQLAGAFEANFPGLARAVRIEKRRDLLRNSAQSYTSLIHLVDSDFFRIFSFDLKIGNRNHVLERLDSVVLTESSARRIFGKDDPIGKRLEIKLGDSFEGFVVRGIAVDPPINSSIRFEMLVPFENVRKFRSSRVMDHWLTVYYETYVLLERPMTDSELQPKLQAVVKLNYPDRYAKIVSLALQPITDIHLNPAIPQGFEPISKPIYSRILALIAMLILVVACVNYMTLSVGRSARRAREVGVRKVLGAQRSQLIRQFLGEAMFMSLLALFLGLILVDVILPAFNNLTNKDLALTWNFTTGIFLAGLIIFSGILAGSYPSIILSRQEASTTIRRKFTKGGANRMMHLLVIGQFALSIALITGTLIIRDQLRFMLNYNLGFEKDQVVIINNLSSHEESGQILDRYRNFFSLRPEVRGVAGASAAFAKDFTKVGFKDQSGDFRSFHQLTVDHDFLSVMGIELIGGRNFSHKFGADKSEAVIVNQALVDYFHWEDPIGKSFPGENFPPHRIIGIVNNFHFESLHEEVAPLVILLDADSFFRGINDVSTTFSPRKLNFIQIRLRQGEELKDSLETLEEAWKEVAPGHPFIFSFLDQDVQRQYQDEERWSKIVGYSSFFAIIIACLGLFGLSALVVSRRTKEIGIRKVLGASAVRVMVMIAREFSLLVIAANVIAWPLAFYAMRRWMNDFAYQVGIRFELFLYSGLLSLLISLLAISYQSIRATFTDPVDTLRCE